MCKAFDTVDINILLSKPSLELNYSGLGVILQADPTQLYLMVISQTLSLLALECLMVLYLAPYFSFFT